MSDFHYDDERVPVIQLWDFLLVPLQGDITDSRAEQLRSTVLQRIEVAGARALIVDASGLVLVDSHLCALLADLARAARLMGAQTILSGLDPGVAQTLMEMGVELSGIEAVTTLERAFTRVGIRYENDEREEARDLAWSLLDAADAAMTKEGRTQ